MATLGSLVAQMDLDSTSFLRNTKNAQTALASLEGSAAKAGAGVESSLAGSSGTLVQIYEAARRAAGGVTKASDDVGASTKKVADAVRGLALPFINELSPALGATGSRLTTIVTTAATLGGGFGGLALAAVGVAGVIGGAFASSWGKADTAMREARGGLVGIQDQIDALEKSMPAKLQKLEELNKVLTRLRSFGAGGTFAKGVEQAGQGVGATRAGIETLRGAAMLEDPAAGPAGPLARKFGEDAAKALFDAEKAVSAFQLRAAEMFADNPLQKLLMAIRKEADDLISRAPALEAVVNATAGVMMDKTVSSFAKAQAPGAAAGLGVSGSMFAGFQDIEKFEGEVQSFTLGIEDLAKKGVPARDLFVEIGKAQEGLDTKVAELTQRFADQPAVLERLRLSFGWMTEGGLQKGLDATVRSVTGGFQGMATVVAAWFDTIDQTSLETVFVPQLANTGIAVSNLKTGFDGVVSVVERFGEGFRTVGLSTDIARSDLDNFVTSLSGMPASLSATHDPIVTVIGDTMALARAFAYAAQQAIFLNAQIGRGPVFVEE